MTCKKVKPVSYLYNIAVRKKINRILKYSMFYGARLFGVEKVSNIFVTLRIFENIMISPFDRFDKI